MSQFDNNDSPFQVNYSERPATRHAIRRPSSHQRTKPTEEEEIVKNGVYINQEAMPHSPQPPPVMPQREETFIRNSGSLRRRRYSATSNKNVEVEVEATEPILNEMYNSSYQKYEWRYRAHWVANSK